MCLFQAEFCHLFKNYLLKKIFIPRSICVRKAFRIKGCCIYWNAQLLFKFCKNNCSWNKYENNVFKKSGTIRGQNLPAIQILLLKKSGLQVVNPRLFLSTKVNGIYNTIKLYWKVHNWQKQCTSHFYNFKHYFVFRNKLCVPMLPSTLFWWKEFLRCRQKCIQCPWRDI